jgi:imidazolonepropionase-like amidohydrolase
MKWREEISAGKLTGPVIFTSGPKLDGVGGTWAGSLEVEDEEEITLALDSLQSIGTDYVKLYDSKISGDLYLKTIEQAERRGLITSGHMPFTVQLEETIAAGIDGIEHLYYIMKGCSSLESEITVKLSNDEIGFWDAMPLLQQTYEDSTAQKTFRRLKDSKVFVVPTLHIGKTLSYLDEVDHDDDPYLKYMGAGIIETYQGRIDAARKATPQTILNRKKLDTFFGELTESLSDAGVKLLAGSDSGAYNSYTYPGISLHKELEALVACGLSPLEALRASAYNGSLFLKQEADYGTVVEGKISDLVLLNANPLQDIANTKNIYLVLQGQKIYTSEELNNFLKEVIVN